MASDQHHTPGALLQSARLARTTATFCARFLTVDAQLPCRAHSKETHSAANKS